MYCPILKVITHELIHRLEKFISGIAFYFNFGFSFSFSAYNPAILDHLSLLELNFESLWTLAMRTSRLFYFLAYTFFLYIHTYTYIYIHIYVCVCVIREQREQYFIAYCCHLHSILSHIPSHILSTSI